MSQRKFSWPRKGNFGFYLGKSTTYHRDKIRIFLGDNNIKKWI